MLCDGLIAIEDSFHDCKKLVEVELPSTVTIVHKSFVECSALMKLGLCTGLLSVRSEQFFGCRSLKYIDISSTVTEIGERAFIGCF